MADKNTGNVHYGGQAVIEGVMMRGKKHFAIACRRTHSNEIVTTTEPVEKGILGKLKWLNKPVLRGTLAMIDTFALGYKSLMWSANQALEDEQIKQQAEKGELPDPANGNESTSITIKNSKANDILLSITPFIAIGIAMALFMFLPAYLTKKVLDGVTKNPAWLGFLEGGFKALFLFLYVWGVSRMKDVRRVFEYHGAEHKTINALEAGEELTVENVQKYSTIHVRCGTSFLLIVILVGIIVFAAVPWNFTGPVWLAMLKRAAFKLPLMIPVAGLAYEIIKFAGNKKESFLTRLLLAPGLLMQRVTTKPPSDDQVEVAIRSLQCVREIEQEESAGK